MQPFCLELRAGLQLAAAMAAAVTDAHGARRAALPAGASATGVLAALRAARAAAHAASGLAWTQGFGEEARLARSAEAALDAGIAKFIVSGSAIARGRRGRRGRGGGDADAVQARRATACTCTSESDAMVFSGRGLERCENMQENVESYDVDCGYRNGSISKISAPLSQEKVVIKDTLLNVNRDEEECSGSISAPERLEAIPVELNSGATTHVTADNFYMGEITCDVSVQASEEQLESPRMRPLESHLALWAEAYVAAEQLDSLAASLGVQQPESFVPPLAGERAQAVRDSTMVMSAWLSRAAAREA